MSDSYACELEEVDLEQALLIGDLMNLLDGSSGAFCSDAEIARRLDCSVVSLVTEPREESRNSIGSAETLHVAGSHFAIKGQLIQVRYLCHVSSRIVLALLGCGTRLVSEAQPRQQQPRACAAGTRMKDLTNCND